MCTGEARPVDGVAGATWTTLCAEGASTDSHNGVVVGSEVLTVGTTSVTTTHVRVSIADGTATDTQVTDTWYQAGTDLVIAQSGVAATSNQSSVGVVHYAEHYEIHLTALDPLT